MTNIKNMKNILNKVPENVHSVEVNEEWNNNPNIQLTDLRGVSKSLDEVQQNDR